MFTNDTRFYVYEDFKRWGVCGIERNEKNED